MPERRKRGIVTIGAVLVLLAGAAVYLLARPTVIEGGSAPLAWAECHPDQIEVMTLGTFHFAQVADDLDVLEPRRQAELASILDRLEDFSPDRITLEYPHAGSRTLDSLYAAYLASPPDSLGSRNERRQIGFRLARRLGHERVYAVDAPIDLWHDSIATFDERWPDARGDLRGRWHVRYADRNAVELDDRRLDEILAAGNVDQPPANAEMYRRFLPLVEGDVYAGALKLRPWYDRNLRIVQNLFRVADPADDRILLVVGWGHMRVLKQILELTPQLCPVDPAPYLSAEGG